MDVREQTTCARGEKSAGHNHGGTLASTAASVISTSSSFHLRRSTNRACLTASSSSSALKGMEDDDVSRPLAGEDRNVDCSTVTTARHSFRFNCSVTLVSRCIRRRHVFKMDFGPWCTMDTPVTASRAEIQGGNKVKATNAEANTPGWKAGR